MSMNINHRDQEIINRIAIALIREFQGEPLEPVLRLLSEAGVLLLDLSLDPTSRFAGLRLLAEAGCLVSNTLPDA
jgi:hypothetical protein